MISCKHRAVKNTHQRSGEATNIARTVESSAPLLVERLPGCPTGGRPRPDYCTQMPWWFKSFKCNYRTVSSGDVYLYLSRLNALTETRCESNIQPGLRCDKCNTDGCSLRDQRPGKLKYMSITSSTKRNVENNHPPRIRRSWSL